MAEQPLNLMEVNLLVMQGEDSLGLHQENVNAAAVSAAVALLAKYPDDPDLADFKATFDTYQATIIRVEELREEKALLLKEL